MNVLLVYPQFPDTFWSFKHALEFIRKRASLPPLGLLTVAALLPPEWELRLVDVNVRRLSDADLTWSDMVFLSGMTIQRDSAREIIARSKAAGRSVVAGGPLFTIEHESFPGVDHFVLDEAELTLPAFLSDLSVGRARPIYRAGGYPDLHSSPSPRWELAELNRYATMSVQYSRGCPYNCDFCNVTALFGHRPRTKTAGQMLVELDGLYRLGWRESVFFVDDNFIGNRRHLKDELLPALIEWRRGKRGMTFHTEVSINLADDAELMEMMVAAGFDKVFIGIETPDEGSLAECGKKQNLKRDLVADVKRIQRIGMQVQGGFIVGFDHDSPSIFQRQIDFIQNSGIVTAMVGLLQAPPGTELYSRLQAAGRLLERISGDNVDGSTNIIPRMNLNTLREGYRGIMAHIYSPEHYYQRVKTFLREYRPPRVKSPLRGEHILAFLRSIIRLGILGQERVYYWRLLLWTLLNRPRSFSLAVTLAIYGYHFRKVSELRVL